MSCARCSRDYCFRNDLVLYCASCASSGDKIALGAIGRMVLDQPDCPDRNAIQALVNMLSRAPERWEKSLEAFAANPSVEAWDNLLQFCPVEVHYQRVKNTLRMLACTEVTNSIRCDASRKR